MPQSFKDKTILVVGGAGFVGSNLVKLLMKQGPQKIIIIDNLLSSDAFNVPKAPEVVFVKASINDPSALGAIPEDLDYAFHLSCFHGNQSSIHDPLADHENNTLTSLNLFNRLKGLPQLKKVVYAGAGCAVAPKTYDTPTATSEDAPISLIHDSPYSISKLVGEMYAHYFANQFKLPAVVARFQNVYGPGEILGAGQWRGTPHTVWRNVTPTFVFKALHNEALPLENGGAASRDFIFVEDMARGLMACAQNGIPGQTYNLASGSDTTIRVLAEKICELTGCTNNPIILPRRDWDRSGRRFGDPTKALMELGFECQVSLDVGLEKTVAWTTANMRLIKTCMGQHKEHVPSVSAYL